MADTVTTHFGVPGQIMYDIVTVSPERAAKHAGGGEPYLWADSAPVAATSVTPATGGQHATVPITIVGTGFNKVNGVDIVIVSSGVPFHCTTFVRVDDEHITCSVDPGAGGNTGVADAVHLLLTAGGSFDTGLTYTFT